MRALLLVLLASCAAAPVMVEPPLVVEHAPCLVKPPPPHAHWHSTPCTLQWETGQVCTPDAETHQNVLLTSDEEIEALRFWSIEAWTLCRVTPPTTAASAPNVPSLLIDPEPRGPHESARVAPAD